MNTNRLVTGALALLVCTLPAAAQDPSEIQRRLQEAFDQLVAGNEQLETNHEQAMASYETAVKLYADLIDDVDQSPLPLEAKEQVTQLAHYNTACARSLQGKKALALDALEKAFDSGWMDLEHTAKDTDLDAIRSEARYAQVIANAGKTLDKRALAKAEKTISSGKLFDYDFSITTLEGKPLRLADLKGKVVIVDYWGTWCGPCRKEIPHFVELAKEFGDRLAIVGLAWEQGASGSEVEAKVKAFAQEAGIKYALTVISDREELRKVPGFSAFPTTLFIDKSGAVRAKEVGYRDLRTLRAMIRVLDAESAPAAAPAKKTPKDDFF